MTGVSNTSRDEHAHRKEGGKNLVSPGVLDHAEGGMLSAVHLDLPIDAFKNMLEH